MAHLQQQILEAVQAVLVAGDTAAGEYVKLDVLDRLHKAVTHAILIREGESGDEIQPGTIRDLQERDFEVEIACVLRAREGEGAAVAAEAREFGLAVEKLLSPQNTTLAALCKGGWRLTNSRLAQSGEGEEAVASRLQTWHFKYLVRKATPDTAA